MKTTTQLPLWNTVVVLKFEPYSFWVWLDNIGVGIIPLLSISVSCTVAEVEGVADGVHVAEDGGVENAGVAFGHLDAGMTKHTRDVFKADAL